MAFQPPAGCLLIAIKRLPRHPDPVQFDKLMVDILSGQVVNKSDGRNDDAAEGRQACVSLNAGLLPGSFRCPSS
jgi:hypothetical protein